MDGLYAVLKLNLGGKITTEISGDTLIVSVGKHYCIINPEWVGENMGEFETISSWVNSTIQDIETTSVNI